MNLARLFALVVSLSKQEYKQRFVLNVLGSLWTFINPIVTIGILWFVFSFGFRSPPIQNYPFSIWLMAGMIPWFFLSECFITTSTSVIEKPYLVKKLVFPIEILSLIKVLIAMIPHLWLIFLLLIISFFFEGIGFHFYLFQIFYYIFCEIALILSLSWITSSISVFVRDTTQIISIFVQFGFWLTPIIWSVSLLPERFRFLIYLNPVYYITEGFRESLLMKIGFWEHWELTVYFWTLNILLFFFGFLIFKKLKIHFADIL